MGTAKGLAHRTNSLPLFSCEHEHSLMMETSSHSSGHPRHWGQCLITRGCSVTPLHAQMKLVLQAGEFPRRESWTLTGQEKSKPRSSSSLHRGRKLEGNKLLVHMHEITGNWKSRVRQAASVSPQTPVLGRSPAEPPSLPLAKWWQEKLAAVHGKAN